MIKIQTSNKKLKKVWNIANLSQKLFPKDDFSPAITKWKPWTYHWCRKQIFPAKVSDGRKDVSAMFPGVGLEVKCALARTRSYTDSLHWNPNFSKHVRHVVHAAMVASRLAISTQRTPAIKRKPIHSEIGYMGTPTTPARWNYYKYYKRLFYDILEIQIRYDSLFLIKRLISCAQKSILPSLHIDTPFTTFGPISCGTYIFCLLLKAPSEIKMYYFFKLLDDIMKQELCDLVTDAVYILYPAN